ncbi:MAG: pyruvate dehydrogenase (acetyl-transferring), homodimeric type, partial [Candidatus Latescibacterota bacterium]|nr:pyruvate dehydrogenase (acetyl-transferring), homodimeric type [Candidatus Latescibacterota bacterium]
ILKGMYRIRTSKKRTKTKRAHLFGSASILTEALQAAQILETDYGVAADVWSVTSYKQLHEDAVDAERWNLLHPGEPERVPYLSACLAQADGALVIASDYVKALPDMVARWFPRPPVTLGTDGFGRSESRQALRRFFEVDAQTIAYAALVDLFRQGALSVSVVDKAQFDLGIDPDKANPVSE